MKDKVEVRYKELVELNSKDSPSTGTIVCYDGSYFEKTDEFAQEFIEISDCYHKVKLHRATHDSLKDWQEKIDKLVVALIKYRIHLSKNRDEINEIIERSDV